MGKLDELRRTAVGNIDESMGAGRSDGGIHRVSAPGPRPISARLQGVTRSQNVASIPVDRIGADPDQPREEFEPEALLRLADSLKTRGQISPITVRWDEGRGQYVVVCGERRWRAAGLAGLPTMLCVIAEGPVDAGELFALQLIENCVREDLRPIEQAKAFRALMDRNGWSGNHLAKVLGIAQPSVVRALALLDLPPAIKERVEQGALPAATAYEIGKLADPEAQADVAALALAEGLNRAEVVEAVRRKSAGSAGPGKGRGARSKPRKTSTSFRTAAGFKVTVEHRRGVDDVSAYAALLDAAAIAKIRGSGRGEAADQVCETMAPDGQSAA